MGSLPPANGTQIPSPTKRNPNSYAELVSSFGIRQIPPAATHARGFIERTSLSPLEPQSGPSTQHFYTSACESEDRAVSGPYNGSSTRFPGISLDGDAAGPSMIQNWNFPSTDADESVSNIGARAQSLGTSTTPISIDSSEDDTDSANDILLNDSTPQQLASRSYSSPIYLVDETDSDLSAFTAVATPTHSVNEDTEVGENASDHNVKQESTVIVDTNDDDAYTEKPPCTPTRTPSAAPSTPGYLLSCMNGDDSAASDSGTLPDSPSLRRSRRSRNTPMTYSLKRLTFPESTPRRIQPKQFLFSDLQSSPSRPPPKPLTARKRVREEIAKVTKVKRDRFLKYYQDVFLPLLPEQNYISHLESQQSINDYMELTEQPAGVTATLKPHQMVGLSFLVHMHNNGMACILGDEMGLGKTLQTLSLFQWIEEQPGTEDAENRPYLVVCPLTVLGTWVSEAKKWTPGLKVLSLHGDKAERQRLKRKAIGNDRKPGGNSEEEYKIIVTTYESFVAEQVWFKKAFAWRYVVVDEGHMLKNPKTQVAKNLQSISAEYRLMLTGTPLQNDLAELWSILHWMLPDVFSSTTSDLFRKSFNLAKGSADLSVMNNSRRLLEVLMMRRLKSSPGVNLGLPPKSEVLLYVPLTPMQRACYMRLITHQGDIFLNEVFADTKEKEQGAAEELNDASPASSPSGPANGNFTEKKKDNTDFRGLMNLVMQLRKCCNHPYLLPNVEPDLDEVGSHVIQSSGKFIVLEKLLRELILVRKKKVLIFSGFTGMLNLTEDLITLIDEFKTLRIDGQSGRARRNLMMRLFNDPKSEHSVMLISTRAGSLGITLTAATEVIFLDQDWNPQVTLQAEARAHRIGQTSPVTIYKICTQGTVEEQMMGRIAKKLYLSAKITESMKSLHTIGECVEPMSEGRELGTTQLKSLLRRGAQTLTTPVIDVADMTSWNFDQIVAKCKPMDPAIAESEVDEEGWLNTMEHVETAIFDGRRIERENAWTETPVQLELDRTQRRTGKNTTVEVDGFFVSKESLDCGDWEAVPTMAGKNPTLSSPKRQKKPPFCHQSYCQVCWRNGEMVECSICPRSYHRDCLDGGLANYSVIKGQYFCPQHRCRSCGGKSSEVGDLLYRCRFCTASYCENCLDFEQVNLLGFSLPEFQILDYGANANTFFIKCQSCISLDLSAPELRAYSEEQMKKWETTWDDFRTHQPPEIERKDSMNPLSLSSQEEDGPTRGNSSADDPIDTEPSIPWSGPCRSPTKRNASPSPHDPTGSPKAGPSPSKKLKFGE